MKDDKNFCMALWMHLHVINDGRSFPCCHTPLKDEYSLGNVNDKTLIEIINDDKAKEMRRGMMAGKELPESCHRCVDKEKYGLSSMRTGFNDSWYDDELIKNTLPDGTITDFKLKFWDFRFSNYCNLACDTCGPLFSTKWANDHKELHPNAPFNKPLVDLSNADIFWKDIDQYIPSVKEIHFAGGEPMIMSEHWRVLDMLDKKKQYDVGLRYSTNATMMDQPKHDPFQYWKKFRDVHLSVSIDAANDAFEYIRYGGKWSSTLKNLTKIRESGVGYWIHPTISNLNIFRITELHEILENNDIIPILDDIMIPEYWIRRMHMNVLFVPSRYSITTLPKELKEQASEKIYSYGKQLEQKKGVPFTGWQSVLDYMNGNDDSHLFGEFIRYSKRLDEIRNRDFLKINPEFKGFF